MLLNELLRPELIKVGLEAQDKEEAISELVDLLVQEHEISMKHRQGVVEDILAAEKDQGTGMEDGIAIPHALTDNVEDLLCAIGTSKDGVSFNCLDGKPANLIVLLVAPKRNFIGEIRALAGIQHLLEHETLNNKIVESDSAAAIYKLIEAEEPEF